ncbi:MAG: hypothetical protein FJ290_08610 [Planctomycetes bacterium]|nr:hypothetical protein [Planctomycetota bacterium]
MKLLFDQNLSFRLCSSLQEEFPDSAHVRLLGLEEASDSDIWEYARDHGFTIVTKDEDFYELSLLRGSPPKILWLRCGNVDTATIERLIQTHVERISSFAEDEGLHCLELY